jgi:hypothetical protein
VEQLKQNPHPNPLPEYRARGKEGYRERGKAEYKARGKERYKARGKAGRAGSWRNLPAVNTIYGR